MEYFTDVHFKILISLIALNESKKVPKNDNFQGSE